MANQVAEVDAMFKLLYSPDLDDTTEFDDTLYRELVKFFEQVALERELAKTSISR